MRILFFAVAAMLFTCTVPAQDTNLWKTDIQNFEARTNTVIIKGIGQIGSASVGGGTVLLRSKESVDAATGGKIYGIELEMTWENSPRQEAILDEAELEPLVNGLDYLSKITSDASGLPSFTAEFKTRSGLRFIAHSSRRQSSIEHFLQFDGAARVPLNTDEFVQLKNLAGQALGVINDLKRSR